VVVSTAAGSSVKLDDSGTIEIAASGSVKLVAGTVEIDAGTITLSAGLVQSPGPAAVRHAGHQQRRLGLLHARRRQRLVIPPAGLRA
jgi:hypothetical protein